MTLVILTILILACVLIATENVTKVNRAAVAIFAGTVGWVLYICFGMDFVTSEHSADYTRFLNFSEMESTSTSVKYFISRNIFLPQVGRAATSCASCFAHVAARRCCGHSPSLHS